MIKVNAYFDGNVKSLGFEREKVAFTAGVVLPGEYTFDTQSEEHLTITVGEIEVQPPGSGWRTVKAGETITIPAKTNFDLKGPLIFVQSGITNFRAIRISETMGFTASLLICYLRIPTCAGV